MSKSFDNSYHNIDIDCMFYDQYMSFYLFNILETIDHCNIGVCTFESKLHLTIKPLI